MRKIVKLETERAALQEACDGARTQSERNRLGQFATPQALALEIMNVARSLTAVEKIRFLDPAFGTGSFFSALLRTFKSSQIEAAVGFEIDRHYAVRSADLWRETKLDLRIGDFTAALPPRENEKFNLIVCNPPYVRHHHLSAENKSRLKKVTHGLSGVSLSGLTGLYCYFLLLAHAWAAQDGLCVWLIPGEFMDVNYGIPLKEYLLKDVTLLQIHRFSSGDVQFTDALVSSSLICFRKSPPPKTHTVKFTLGGSLSTPSVLQMVPLSDLRSDCKWNGRGTLKPPLQNNAGVKLSDFFDIKRGLATGDNKFFILTQEQIRANRLPMKWFKPILPGPRHLPTDEIQADVETGYPIIEEPLFLLDCPLSENAVQREYPTLWKYLETGKRDVALGYLCRSRSPWYSQEHRPPTSFLCTYMGRAKTKNGAAFRFLLNHSSATAANVYLLLYPKVALRRALQTNPELPRRVWSWLNTISPDVVSAEGRVYGGGLHKVEPRELGKVPAEGLAKMLNLPETAKPAQLNFFSASA